ncbi:toxin, partial [Pseudomonas sp. PDM04]|nr:toxin [Pseudomonas sp. PDM04]
MQPPLASLHRDTPKLAVVEPRGLAVRVVDYHRAAASDTVQAQVNHTAHDPQGRANDLRDPRLFLEASSPANLSMTHSLSGAVLCSVSVDAGLRLRLLGEDGQPVHDWDGRGARRLMHYDAQRRLTTLFEQAQGGEAVCTERLSYAANDQAAADHNQCGRLIQHDDPAGTLHFIHYALTGSVLAHRRHFSDAPLPGFTTSVRLNPLGESLSRTDAQGNEQQFAQSLAGHLRSVWLRLSDTTERRPIVAAIHYNAQDQVEKEVAGNGVVTTLEYCAQSGRLTRLLSRLEQHAPLQDLQYAYDPVGNVLSIEDAALPVRHFANQRIEPLNRYRYDSLYRLIDATGWEAGGVDHGPASRVGADPAMPGNYRQTYR